MRDLDNLSYGPIQWPESKYVDQPTPRFKPGWESIRLPPPPKNSSVQTRVELEEIQKLRRALRPEDWHVIMSQDVGFDRQFNELVAGDAKLLTELDELTGELSVICNHFKVQFNRPRPEQVFKALGISIDIPDSKSAITPAYPSGHAFIAWFFGMYLSNKYQALKLPLMGLAAEIGWNRVRAGWHFPSDYEAGVHLARLVFPYLKSGS